MTYRTIPALTGMQTLAVIFAPGYPTSGGNSFWFASGPRCLNINAENFEEAARRFLPDGLVLVETNGRTATVIDPRIPPDWLA